MKSEQRDSQVRVRGRQARLDLIRRIVGERRRELEGLLELRAVSDFAHCGRIQLFLRGRFLRNERPQEYERPPSVAARELSQLRQRHLVSGLREGFRFVLENVRGLASAQYEGRDDGQQQNDTIEHVSLNHEHLQSVTENYEAHQTAEMLSTADVESIDMTDNMNLQPFISEGDDWREQNANHMAEDRQHSVRNIPAIGVNSFIPPDDDNMYSMELRELLRRVKVLLYQREIRDDKEMHLIRMNNRTTLLIGLRSSFNPLLRRRPNKCGTQGCTITIGIGTACTIRKLNVMLLTI